MSWRRDQVSLKDVVPATIDGVGRRTLTHVGLRRPAQGCDVELAKWLLNEKVCKGFLCYVKGLALK
jgi:hypothetical protein